jgi:hypothetical protein
MRGPEKEDLRELFERFVEAEQANEAVEDILKGEQILRDNAAPEPDARLIVSIKAQIAKELSLRRAKASRWAYYRVAAVAAVIVIVASIGVKLINRGGESGGMYASAIMPAAIWESANITVDDPQLAVLSAAVEEIESEVWTLQEGETGGNGSQAVAELEVELAVINSGL